MGNKVKELGHYEGIAYRQVRTMMASRGWTLEKLAEELGKAFPEAETTPNNLANKLYRGTIRFCDMERIAEVMGYSYSPQPYRVTDTMGSLPEYFVKGKDKEDIAIENAPTRDSLGMGWEYERKLVQDRIEAQEKAIKELRKTINSLTAATKELKELDMKAESDKKASNKKSFLDSLKSSLAEA